MAYTVRISTRFKKDFKRCMKRGLDMKLITDAMDLLEATGLLAGYIIPCYDVLHTFSKEYMVEDLTQALREKGALA